MKKFNLQRIVGKQRNWQCIFLQNVAFFVSVTLLGLYRIFKTGHRWKDLYFLKFLFTTKSKSKSKSKKQKLCVARNENRVQVINLNN